MIRDLFIATVWLIFSTAAVSLAFRLIRKINCKKIKDSSNLSFDGLDQNVLIFIIFTYSLVYILTSISYCYFHYEKINIFKENDNFLFNFFINFGLFSSKIEDDFIYFVVLSVCVFLMNFVMSMCRWIICGPEFSILRGMITFNSFIFKWLFIFLLKAPIMALAFFTPTFIFVLNNKTKLFDNNLYSLFPINYWQYFIPNIFYFTIFSMVVCLVEKIPVYDFKKIISENKKEIFLMTLQPVARYFGFTLSTDHNPASVADDPKAPQPDGSSAQDRQK